MTHTPGPWQAMHHDTWRNLPSTEQPSTIAHCGDYAIATFNPSYEFHGADVDDANLIAAAPEMLAALRAAAGYLHNAKIDLVTRCTKRTAIKTIEGGIQIVEATIAKAEAKT